MSKKVGTCFFWSSFPFTEKGKNNYSASLFHIFEQVMNNNARGRKEKWKKGRGNKEERCKRVREKEKERKGIGEASWRKEGKENRKETEEQM